MFSPRRLFVSFAIASLVAATSATVAQQAQTSSAPPDTTEAPIVKAPAGDVEGIAEGGLHVFRAIPYAEPPVGPLRWKPPVPLPRWTGVRKATVFGPACFQPEPTLSKIYTRGPLRMSEDCLTLNIWEPAGAHNAPVFFWIHGGALLTGVGGDAMYDGARIASRGLVVVTINYRVGVFGWLAHPELSRESPLGISGNYGLLDQIQALHWVKSNISAFGGDPANVTIVGESSGALNVMSLIASPPARGLFAKGIAESAYMITMPELKQSRYGTPSAEESGAALAAALHAPNLAALRAMDAAELTRAANAAGYTPWEAIDGHVLPRQLVDVYDRGEQARVPILTGFNSGEIRSLRILAPPPPGTASAYEYIIRTQYRDLAAQFLELYPATNLQESIFATTRDAFYGWTSVRLVKKQAALGVPSFLYLWDHGYPAADDADLHGFHASEVPFVFGNFNHTPPFWPKIPDTPQERKLSDAIIDYWTSFARTGHPTAANEPDWPAYAPTDAYMDITDAPHPSTHLFPGMYELDEQVVCRRRASGDQPWNWNVGIIAPLLPARQSRCK